MNCAIYTVVNGVKDVMMTIVFIEGNFYIIYIYIIYCISGQIVLLCVIPHQIMYPESRPGQFYLIDTECVNGGIPYGENFYVVNRFCIARVSSSKCRLRITSQIKYRKNVWGIVKSFIEKNASAGIIDTFTVLGRF